jgi:molecular chaperone DnaK
MEFIEGNTVGIDLGTTFSTLARVNDDGEPVPIPNIDEEVETSSLVLLTESGRVEVGPNRNRAAMEPTANVVERIKRHMGTQEYKRTFDGKEITPEFISALILKKLKQDCEKRIGTISNAVITVPYYFNDARRKATQDAGQIAGLNVIDIINEPTAATLTYAWHRGELGVAKIQNFKARRVLVYDLGGGTFDATLVEYTPSHFHVLATDGDVMLGGVDWNDRILEYACEEFKEKYGADPHESEQVLQILRNDCDFAKMELTQHSEAMVNIRHAGNTATIRISRKKFEEMTVDLLQRTMDTTDFVLEQAGLGYSDLDAFVLVGGSTLMPQVAKKIKEHTGIMPYTHANLDPYTSVAKGAAIHAAILEAQNRKDNIVISNRVKKMLESVQEEDVNSHAIGIVAIDPKTQQKVNHIMIPRNTTLPFEVSQTFKTSRANQELILVKVLEGGAPDPAACLVLGTCRITELPQNLPKGSPVEVTYSLNKNGRLEVKAKELQSSKQANTKIERKGTLTNEQLESFTKLASEYTVE